MRSKINKIRRAVAYKVGLDWHLSWLGYLIDYNRDRFADEF